MRTALSAFLTHSLQEDTYGLAQKELSSTLDGLVSFSAALENLIKMHQDKHDALQMHVQPVLLRQLLSFLLLLFEDCELISCGHSDTNNAFADIALAFRPFLKEFNFSPATSSKLKAVLDYR